jgi:hypothetical protein
VAKQSAASQALSKAVEGLREREGRILWGCDVETGRKKAPDFSAFFANREPMSPAARHALHKQDVQRLPTLTSSTKLQAALQQQQEWSDVTRSHVTGAARRHISQQERQTRVCRGGSHQAPPHPTAPQCNTASSLSSSAQA